MSIVEQLLKHRKMVENGYEKDKRLIPTWIQPFIFKPLALASIFQLQDCGQLA
ncbi:MULTISPECIES: hypothetical protein [Paenibacillus]|uniref:hypothetical protein n=1 Tax=Paenibacillus TaxID=44249 RepID=UPI0013D67A50|nr:hypothetical protein [Paenibacillus sp. ALJ109b]NEU63488.1 hypothetical protein [Paenibacillus sp. ALJ109b]